MSELPTAVGGALPFVRGIAFLRSVARIRRVSPPRLKYAVDSAPIHFRHPAGEINHQPLATQHVRAPRHHDVAEKRSSWWYYGRARVRACARYGVLVVGEEHAAAKAFSKRSPYSHAVIRNLLKPVSALGG
jgi:hypothetical protein